MDNNLHLLETLKEKLISGADFAEIMNYFFDHFAENHEFMKLGRVQHSNLVETITAQAAASALGKDTVVIREMRIVRLPRQKFCHGPCFIDGHIATLFFFEDIQTGMLAIALSAKGGQMLFARITAVPMPKKQEAKWN
jgi:hypothetical protein